MKLMLIMVELWGQHVGTPPLPRHPTAYRSGVAQFVMPEDGHSRVTEQLGARVGIVKRRLGILILVGVAGFA